MAEMFLKIINMSISATYIVLAILLLRLLLRKAPKWISVILWGIVAVRLVCPFSIESVLSLIPSSEVISPTIMTDKTPTINTGIPIINSALNPVIGESFAPNPGDSANPLQIWIPVLTTIWIVGMVALLLYTAISYAKMKRKIGTAVLCRDNIYQSENVLSPFVLGITKPKIYLPFGLSEKDMEHVVAHEMAHIRRKDHLWKLLGFLLLALHWFNPMMWIGFLLLCRDIELACDEKVVKRLDRDARADYSEALLICSVSRRMIAACPLAFGEVDVKDRVKSVLNYKKPAFWIIIVAVVTCVALAAGFLTSPPASDDQTYIVGVASGIRAYFGPVEAYFFDQPDSIVIHYVTGNATPTSKELTAQEITPFYQDIKAFLPHSTVMPSSSAQDFLDESQWSQEEYEARKHKGAIELHYNKPRKFQFRMLEEMQELGVCDTVIIELNDSISSLDQADFTVTTVYEGICVRSFTMVAARGYYDVFFDIVTANF